MLSLKIDSKTQVIEAEVMLKGEVTPISVTVTGYALENGVFRARDVKVSREWMDLLAREMLGKGVPVPADIAKWMGMVL